MLDNLPAALEAILFAAGEPVSIKRLSAALAADENEIESAAAAVARSLEEGGHGIRLVRLEDSYQLCSAPVYADFIRPVLETRKPPQLSAPALEVLAITAYFQPVTRAYVEQVRGVDSSHTMSVLVDRGLIEPRGTLDAPGRPTLFGTTPAFLRVFGLSSLSDLPALPEKDGENEESAAIEAAIKQLEPGGTAEG
jgi:segregation and condensation protein B